jgi:hypothetical protein
MVFHGKVLVKNDMLQIKVLEENYLWTCRKFISQGSREEIILS